MHHKTHTKTVHAKQGKARKTRPAKAAKARSQKHELATQCPDYSQLFLCKNGIVD